MTRTEVLEKAKAIVEGKREEYPENSFALVAKLWTLYMQNVCIHPYTDIDGKYGEIVSITEGDVAMMMALLKVARIAGGHYKSDSYVDLCGYAAWAAELADNE